MRMTRLRRSLALVTSVALLASLVAATVAAPASAAKPKCQGKTATIVGTRKAEVIRGTAKRDIIVARGGHDRIFGRGGNDLICAGGGNDTVYGGPGADTIWGQLGNDRLFGNAGPDFLAGQVGHDALNGGISVDKCFQGTGSGPRVACEQPAPPPPAPAPAPPAKTLAIAYSDLNGNHAFDTGDVMISRLVDTNLDGKPGRGDTIEMGRYPGNFNATLFGDWRVKSHEVSGVRRSDADWIEVETVIGRHVWANEQLRFESYWEYLLPGPGQSLITDYRATDGSEDDFLLFEAVTASRPSEDSFKSEASTRGDQEFIDVDIYP